LKTTLLDVRNLKTCFSIESEEIAVVDSVSFTVEAGETLGIVGESGSGKSVTALSILRLVPSPPGRIKEGEILFEGEDLLLKSEEEMRRVRGNRISMIFQEPMTSLNPVHTIGGQISEALMLHQGLSKKEALEKSKEMLNLCKVSLPHKRIRQYPHELSGGMRQRVMIAMALACNPRLLIADEPTTALDVTVQAQILELIVALQRETGSAVLFITHDLGVISEVADHVAVMYCGRIVEYGQTGDVLSSPLHPYTRGLLNSLPSIGGAKKPLRPIRGTVPAPNEIRSGCRFRPRCDESTAECDSEEPPLIDLGGRLVRCRKWLSLEKTSSVRLRSPRPWHAGHRSFGGPPLSFQPPSGPISFCRQATGFFLKAAETLVLCPHVRRLFGECGSGCGTVGEGCFHVRPHA